MSNVRDRGALLAIELAFAAICIEATKSSWEDYPAGTLNRRYVKFLGETLLRLMRKSPISRARADLKNFAAQLARGKGRYSWQGAHRSFATRLGKSVNELASWYLPSQRAGRTASNKGLYEYPRTVVARKFDLFTRMCIERGRPELIIELYRPGSGRDLIRKAAAREIADAKRDVDRDDISGAIRDHVKAATKSRMLSFPPE